MKIKSAHDIIKERDIELYDNPSCRYYGEKASWGKIIEKLHNDGVT